MSREPEHDSIKLGTPVGAHEAELGANRAGDEVSFRKSSQRPTGSKENQTVSIASIVAATAAFILLLFLLSTIGVGGFMGQEDDHPLNPSQLADQYATYLNNPNPPGMPSKAQIQNRLEALKHLEDVGFTSDAKREWIEIHVLTCADDGNPVCRFASKRVRSLR
jgi:hypothetical protein